MSPARPSPALLTDLRQITQSGKSQAVAAVNSALTLTYWHVGKRINDGFCRANGPLTGNR